MKDERKFRDVVETIVTAEEDVDKILKAARLTRHEKANALTSDQKSEIIELAIFAAIILGFFGMLFGLFTITR